MKNNVALIGFMGCGKTTIGKMLADKLNFKFIDTDEYIEKTQNMKISEIFEKFSENHFRQLEVEAVSNVTKNKNCVISTGGGAIINNQNFDCINDSCVIVFINLEYDVILERLKNDKTRPLLSGDKAEQIKSLLEQRLPIYKNRCDFEINGNQSPNLIANQIIDYLRSNNI